VPVRLALFLLPRRLGNLVDVSHLVARFAHASSLVV
jgi:hypothetical protein